jgi:hypothetical protein
MQRQKRIILETSVDSRGLHSPPPCLLTFCSPLFCVVLCCVLLAVRTHETKQKKKTNAVQERKTWTHHWVIGKPRGAQRISIEDQVFKSTAVARLQGDSSIALDTGAVNSKVRDPKKIKGFLCVGGAGVADALGCDKEEAQPRIFEGRRHHFESHALQVLLV